MRPEPWSAVAYNQVPHSENAIHSDEVARRHGFSGGLVPGVTVSAYLMHPALVAWGEAFVARGHSTVRLEKPLYDGDTFQVELDDAGEAAYAGRVVRPDGVVSARGQVSLPDAPGPAPERRGDPRAPRREERPRASREVFERLREEGMGSVRSVWDERAEITRYLRDEAAMAALVRPSERGMAHPGFILGMTNWVLARNVKLGPWIHAETECQHHAPIPYGSELMVEARVVDLFERKGHSFVSIDVAAFLPDDRPAMATRLTAIYRLRGEPG